jgi:hypothetical protein
VEYRLRVRDNEMPSKVSGSKRDEVIGEWRRLHNEELYDTSNQIKKHETGGACSKHGRKERRGVCRVFVVKPEEKSPLVKPRYR